jgi:hypothetical protein
MAKVIGLMNQIETDTENNLYKIIISANIITENENVSFKMTTNNSYESDSVELEPNFSGWVECQILIPLDAEDIDFNEMSITPVFT